VYTSVGRFTTGSGQAEACFYPSYGQGTLDPLAMAYYRCERNIVDFSVECGRILSSQVSDADRAKSLLIITWLFLPGGSIEMVYKSEMAHKSEMANKSAALLDSISSIKNLTPFPFPTREGVPSKEPRH
jgi:hypothetical protein